ncbi:phosphate acetyltransferase [Candidatus Woesearchaeota archaeon]|nr:phosphate acetyltransferase [Candidatus Woesearchaeota archaeon]
MEIIETIKETIIGKNKKIIFPEALDERILRAAELITKESIAKIILIGNVKNIIEKIESLGLKIDINNIQIIDSTNPAEDYSEEFYELRKHKGMTLDQAKELLKEPIYYGMMLLKNKKADGLIYGAGHPTSDTLRPALQIIGTKEGIKTASSYFIMSKEKDLIFADCAFVINPSSEELSEIAITTAESARSLGIKPRIAMLSYSTKGSAKHETVDKVAIATELIKERQPELIVEGELQVDAALVPEIAKQKFPESKILGDANILIFPDLNSGNIAYKITQRLGGFKAIGPIIQGLNKPVNDLSRGCSVQDIVDVTIITCAQDDN